MPDCLADAGYFEGAAVTEEDRERSRAISGQRRSARACADAATDLDGYLRSLDMELRWSAGSTGSACRASCS